MSDAVSGGGALNGPLRAIGVAVVIVFVGGSLLKFASPAGRSDPSAAVENGAPRGWLALRLLLDERKPGGRDVVVFDAATETAAKADQRDVVAGLGSGDVVFVPIPERSSFSDTEADALVAAAKRGARVVVSCDGVKARANRVTPLIKRFGVSCVDVDEALAPTTAAAPAQLLPSPVFVRDRARLKLEDRPGLVPLLIAKDGGLDSAVAVAVGVGRGEFVVIASGSVLANDGLAEDENAGFLLWLVGDRRVVVDQRHHTTRGSAAIGKAVLQGPGPLTALVALLLLVPLSLLAFSPRAGDFDGDDDELAPAALGRVRALTALMQADRSTPPPTPTTKMTNTKAKQKT